MSVMTEKWVNLPSRPGVYLMRDKGGKVIYVELMLTPDGIASSQIGQNVGWDGNFDGTLSKLKQNDIASAFAAGIQNLKDAESEKDKVLKCGTSQADPGCSVTIRYVAQVSRAAAPGAVFAQMVTGFALATDPTSKVTVSTPWYRLLSIPSIS